ncbi:SAGA complex subunit spt20 [Lecanosticta acicola]|uniref:SAGA complex subunit spt20 n=1 Tax=Lecanosticta acicola TaxID=111012 RepID=A0AAI8YRY6_9PEZI|nr:SAGA complex subunit spt20 [Lecanosticta acicola]
MTTTTVARPAQALRNRRDAPRPTLPLKRASVMDATAESAGKKRKLNEPHVITKDHILKKFKDRQPSLTVHLHDAHWKFEGQEGSFDYRSPMVAFLRALRKSELPPDMLEELLAGNVPFYDGCLIVEIHNHVSGKGKDKGKNSSATGGDQVRYSMHNYNSYVTPSPFVPYPKKAKENEPPADEDAAKAGEEKKTSAGKDRGKGGTQVVTEVMFPTDRSRHKELLILANTPASEMKGMKRSIDGATPSSAQPPTPQLSVGPNLAAGGRSPGQDNKMCLEDSEIYQFEAEMLLTTQPPLFLEPVKNPREAEKVLEMLAHPLHSDPPPSPKTRKRTTAEMAADDAQAAEAERRMLIMDERIKATTAGDTAGTAQALGFSRFKTIQMVRENHEEQERKKKEEEAQAAAQRKHQDLLEQKEKEQKQQQAEQQRQLMNRRQHQARQAHEMRVQQSQQQAALLAQQQQQQNNLMANQHQGSFQHPVSVPQASPVVRQQTPMMNSSPMLPQNGFPMTATSSQGAGSPQRPTSAAMPNPTVAMARQVSQQHGSRNATPQMAQGTPNVAGAVPNRQMSQTPRMPHGSPAPGTPAAVNIPNMGMTPQQSGMTPEQFAILQAQQRQLQNQSQGGAAGSPSQQIPGQMTPEQFQSINQQQRARAHQQMLLAQQSGATPQQLAQMQQRHRAMVMQQQQMMQQQRMMAASQQNSNASQSPHPSMQGHPQQGGMQQGQQMTPEQMQARQQAQQAQMKQAQMQLQHLHQQYNGFQNIPPQVAHQLPQPVQLLLRQQQQRQQTARAQQMAMRAQQAQNAGQPVAGSGNADPEYMQTLRNHQAMLAQQHPQQSGRGGQMGGVSMSHNMNFNNMQNQQFGGQGQGSDLSAQFQAMQAALNRGNQQGGGQH